MGIKINDYYQDTSEEIAIALGYFDSVHLGHCRLVQECLASKYSSAVFTFLNNPEEILNGSKEQIYTFEERAYILNELGVDYIINAEFNEKFCGIKGADFINRLIDKHNVRMIVVGSDFRYGYKAECGINELSEHCKERNIELKVVDMLLANGSKVASRNIRKMLIKGDIEQVNELLPYKFFLLGRVQEGRKVGGSVLSYPTANVPYPIDKVKIKSGVYHTLITVGSAVYDGITNVGTHPTFEDYIFNVESFILDFNGDLYGKKLKIQFINFIRDVKKFQNVEELKEQITSDIKKIR